MKQPVYSGKGAPPKGPYSPALITEGRQVYISGQGPIDPETGEFITGDFVIQAEQVFQNIGVLLDASGSSWSKVVKVNVYLADSSNFALMNDIYKKYIKEPYPARTTIPANLGSLALIIDCIALVE